MARQVGAALLVACLAWCAPACRSAAPPVPARHAVRDAAALVDGYGPVRVCRGDHDCGQGGVTGSCVLGTCFGLLTTDNPAARHTLAERLRRADADVRAAAEVSLLAALGRAAATQGVRLGAVDGLGAVLQADHKPGVAAACGAACLALRAEAASTDPRLAVAARLALVRGGDATARAAVLDDLRMGTELLRAQAAYALADGAAGRQDPEVVAALLERMRDTSPVVQEAALRGLVPWAGRADVRAAMLELRAGAGAHLGYAIDGALAAAPAAGDTP